MSLNKLVTGYIIFAHLEPVYNQGATVLTTDVTDTIEAFPVFNYAFAYNGDRKGQTYAGGQRQSAAPSGRTTGAKLMLEGKGQGVAYTSSANIPPNLHPYILSSGFTSSFSSASQTWTYSPLPLGTPQFSMYLEVYDRGEKFPVSGAVAEMAFSTKNAGPTEFEFDIKGVAGIISDFPTPPTAAFQASSIIPPKNENIDFTVNGFSGLKLRSYSYKHGQVIAPRIDINAIAGHQGFALGRRKPEFTCVVEAEALSSINPYNLWVSSSVISTSFTVGTNTGNEISVTFPQCTITKATRAADGPLAMWDLTISPFTSAPNTNDDVIIAFS